MAHRVTHLSLSRSLVISFVLVFYQDTGQGVTITSCGFEKNLCNYYQRVPPYDQFNWKWLSGATPTANTGPSSAYEGSYYLYIDTRYNNNGDRAAFQTKGLKFTGRACVSLAYHMYGEDIGTLTLWRFNPRLYLLNKTGDQGNKWFRYQERINNNVNPTTFLIDGFKGSGNKGDIAIDDFSVVTGTCKITVSLPYSCSFESDLCGMWQTGSDDLDWIRTHKANATPAIGSPGNSGGEWIISLASDGKDSPEVASIETPELKTSGNVCVRFKYYLSASNTSSLGIYQEDADSRSLAFNDSEATDSIWRSVSITVGNFASKHWITFSGRFSGGQAARIALDEISISEEICNDCAIGNGGCNHTCTPTDTGRTCSCLSGYTQYEETGCQVTLQPDVTVDEAAATTPGGLTTSDTPGSSLWKILAGVGLGSTVIIAVVVVVVVIIRRRRMTSPNDDHTVTYANDNVGMSSAVTMADDPNNPPEAGVYQEINTTGYVNMSDKKSGPTVEYQNNVVYIKDPYQNLGSNREPLPDPYDTLNE